MGLFDLFKNKKTERINVPSGHSEDNATLCTSNNSTTNICCDNLTPLEVLVLSYTDFNNYFYEGKPAPYGFWEYEYGIKDIQIIMLKLKNFGYVETGSLSDAMATAKLPELKAELQKRDLKVSGKKAELIQRLIENTPENELNTVFPYRPYKVTELGKTIIQKYEWILYIHQHEIEDLDIWNLTAMVQNANHHRYRDIIWGYLNQRCEFHAKNGDFGLYRNTKLKMSEFVAEEKKYRNALGLLVEVSQYDLSMMDNSFFSALKSLGPEKKLSMSYKYAFPYDGSTMKMAPAITQRIKEYSDSLGFSRVELTNFIKSVIHPDIIMYPVFTVDEYVHIIIAEIDADTETLNTIYRKAGQRFKKQYKIKESDIW